MKQYHDLSLDILGSEYSSYKPNRTAVDTIGTFGAQMKFDLTDGFPLLTTKKVHLKSVIHELIWLARGDTNVKYLQDNGVRIWNEWADENGDLGPVYGEMWRRWPAQNGETIDQLANAIEAVKNKSNSRRIIVSAWNPSVMPDTSKSFSENIANGKAALPPCHAFYQFNVRQRDEETYLDCQLYQRSSDTFLGVPFNIASYALATQLIAQEAELTPGVFTHTFGDVHFYCGRGERGDWYNANLDEFQHNINNIRNIGNDNLERQAYGKLGQELESILPTEEFEGEDHIPKILLQLSREPRPLPQMYIRPGTKTLDAKFEDFTLENYNPHPLIKGRVAI